MAEPSAIPEVAAPAETPAEVPVEAAKVETAPVTEVAKTPDKTTERRAEGLARVKREAARLRQKEEAFKTQQATAAMDKRKADHYDQLNRLANEDPLKFLEAAGIKFEDLAHKVLKGNQKSPADFAKEAAEKAISDYKKEQADLYAKRQQAYNDQQSKAVVDGAKKQIADLIDTNPDKFELLKATGRQTIDLVWSRIEEHFDETSKKNGVGEVLDFNKALETVEAELESELEKSLLGTKKMAALLAKKSAAEKAAAEAAEKAPKTMSKVPEVAKTSNPTEIDTKPKRRLSSLAQSREDLNAFLEKIHNRDKQSQK